VKLSLVFVKIRALVFLELFKSRGLKNNKGRREMLQRVGSPHAAD
jgi:hypothetical protein